MYIKKGRLQAFLNSCWPNVLFVSCETVINYQATRTIQVAVTRGLFRKALPPLYELVLHRTLVACKCIHEHKGSVDVYTLPSKRRRRDN